ncbi:LysE family translocator [Brucella pituitosa]
MHPYLFELASLMAIFVFAIVSPGADLAMVIRQSLMQGRREAIITSFGIGAAFMMHVTYTVLGLGLIISQSIYLFNIVKWCGVAYLIYIGIKALRAGTTKIDIDMSVQEPRARQSALKAFSLGFAANALNPKAVFFFLSIFSTVVSLFMTTPKMRAVFSRASKWIDRTSGVVFIALGLKLAAEKAH